LSRLLESLVAQQYDDLEVIVVDQNEDERIAELLAPWQRQLSVVRLQSPRGLSRARNRGVAAAAGDIIGFPDDDCRYPPRLLADVAAVFGAEPDLDAVAGRTVDADGTPTAASWAAKPGCIDIRSVWRRAVSASIFLRRSVLERVGEFDESLGLGSGTPFGSGEETDYLIRALRAGCTIDYRPALAVIHDEPIGQAGDPARRGYAYGMGMGRVLRKHRLPPWVLMYWLARPLGGALISVVRREPGRARYHLAVVRGRAAGWIAKP